MDEVSFLIRLLEDNWGNDSTITAGKSGIKQSDGSAWVNTPPPEFIDIRSIEPGKGNRYDMDTKPVIIIYEDSATLTHPTIDYSVRNEEYTFTIHLRVLHRRDYSELTYSRRQLQSLYQMARHILEQTALRPKVYVNNNSNNAVEASAELVEITGRSEANDRGKRLLGYKMTVTMKRFGRTT